MAKWTQAQKDKAKATRLRNKAKNGSIVAEFPLDVIPERPPTIIRPKVSQEAALIGLCHRMMDHQDRLLDVLGTKKGKPK